MVAFFVARPRLCAVIAAVPISMGIYCQSAGTHCVAETSGTQQKDWKGAWEKGMTGWHLQRTNPVSKDRVNLCQPLVIVIITHDCRH